MISWGASLYLIRIWTFHPTKSSPPAVSPFSLLVRSINFIISQQIMPLFQRNYKSYLLLFLFLLFFFCEKEIILKAEKSWRYWAKVLSIEGRTHRHRSELEEGEFALRRNLRTAHRVTKQLFQIWLVSC